MISVYAYHVFGSVLACAKSAHVFQKLLKLRLHVAFKLVPKPLSIEPAWKPQV